MPVHNRFFLNTSQQIDPSGLAAAGPVLGVEISIPAPLAERLIQEKKPLPSPHTGLALIDTGATRSGVDRVIISNLGVQPVGVATTLTANGPAQQSLYPAHFRFPSENIEIDFSSVLGVDLTGHKVGEQRIIALLGRDVLSRLVLIYNGPGGFFSIAF